MYWTPWTEHGNAEWFREKITQKSNKKNKNIKQNIIKNNKMRTEIYSAHLSLQTLWNENELSKECLGQSSGDMQSGPTVKLFKGLKFLKVVFWDKYPPLMANRFGFTVSESHRECFHCWFHFVYVAEFEVPCLNLKFSRFYYQ